MTNGGLKNVEDLCEELRLLQTKLIVVEQRKLADIETEGLIRTEIQRVTIQISRLVKAQEKTPEC